MLEITLNEAREYAGRGQTIYFEKMGDEGKFIRLDTKFIHLLDEGYKFYTNHKFYISNSIVAVQNVLAELRTGLKKIRNNESKENQDDFDIGRNYVIDLVLARTDKYMKLNSKEVSS